MTKLYISKGKISYSFETEARQLLAVLLQSQLKNLINVTLFNGTEVKRSQAI